MKISSRLYISLIVSMMVLILSSCGGGGVTVSGAPGGAPGGTAGGGNVNSSPGVTYAQNISWTPPTQRVNTSLPPLTNNDLKEYRLYYGTASGKYDHTVSVGTATEIDFTGTEMQSLNLVPGGTYFAAVTYVDTTGLESGLSNEKMFVCPLL